MQGPAPALGQQKSVHSLMHPTNRSQTSCYAQHCGVPLALTWAEGNLPLTVIQTSEKASKIVLEHLLCSRSWAGPGDTEMVSCRMREIELA